MKIRVVHYSRSGYPDAESYDVVPIVIAVHGRFRLPSLSGGTAEGQIVYWSTESGGFSIDIPALADGRTWIRLDYAVDLTGSGMVYGLIWDKGDAEGAWRLRLAVNGSDESRS